MSMSASTSPVMMATTAAGIQQNDPKKLVEYLMNDLRALSTEARKKHNHIKEAAESGQVKVRNISSTTASLSPTSTATPTDHLLLQQFRASSTELLHPFLLGCSSKCPRLVQISLQSIQRMLQFQAVDRNAVPAIVNELWNLTEAECEELKVLQTITPFVSTELLVTDWALARCIVLAFRLNFSKDSSVINAASAAVRQLFNCVFERVIQEDGMERNSANEPTEQDAQKAAPQQKSGQNQQQQLAPQSLRPAAADGFLLLRDLCTLIRKEQPNWLVGVQKVTPILALELLESVVKGYPSIFFKHPEFGELLKTQIAGQIIKMVVGERELTAAMLAPQNANGAALQAATQPQQQIPQTRPLPVSAALLSQQMYGHGHQQQQSVTAHTKARDFPVMIRALRIALALITHYHTLLGTQAEVILHFLLDLLNHASTSWEAAVAIEVLRKLMAQPTLLSWFCTRPDGPKFIELLFSRLTTFVRKCLEEAAIDGPTLREENYAQPGFIYKGVFLPLDEAQLSAKRSILLDWLDKHHAEKIPEAYCLSLGFATLVDATHAIYSAIEGEHSPSREKGEEAQEDGDTAAKLTEYSDHAKELYQSSYVFLIAGLSTLLEFSMDDALTEQLLSCMSTLVALACRTGLAEAKHFTLKSICRAALPSQYFVKFIESPATLNTFSSTGSTPSNGSLPSGRSGSALGMADPKEHTVEPTQVVAMGTVCPSPHLPTQNFNSSVMLTAKNLQVARLLINCVHANGQLLGDCWEMALTVIQHFVWIIGLRPTWTGTFRAGGETAPTASSESGAVSAPSGANSSISGSGASTVILTTAASSELPDLNQQLNSLFETSSQQLDEVSLHHVIAALCKLSNEQMTVAQQSSRETSFFAVAKLLQTALANLARLHIFWRPVTAHLLELCAHSNTVTREWGAIALTQLIKSGMKQTVTMLSTTTDGANLSAAEIAKREQLIMNPLCAMSEIDFLDVRAKQLDCLMRVLQAESRPMEPQLWPMVINIVTAVVAPEARISDPQLIDQGFRALSLVVKEFLSILPFECVEMLVETNARYGQQQFHLNVSLASVGQLWDISDFVRRETSNNSNQQNAAKKRHGKEEVERVWLVIYHALGRLCVDPRPPVRKSACDTLLQTVAAHGQALGTQCWAKMLTEILFPMLDRVRVLTQTASTQRSNTNSLGAPNLMIHHSRDTESKQWSETSVKTLGGVIKIFNAQRPVLLHLENFPDCWAQLLRHIELAAQADNAEMSLAALKNLQELLFGRQQPAESNLPQNGKSPRNSSGIKNEPDLTLAPTLPEPLWIVSWQSWFRIAQAIVFPECPATLDIIEGSSNTAGFVPTTKKHYVPGLYHLSTLLEVFLWLFQRVRRHVPVEDVRQHRIGQIFQDIAAIPLSADQLLISMVQQQPQSSSTGEQQLNQAQECLLNCTRAIIQEQMDPGGTSLRPALPDMLRLLLSFVQFAWQSPVNKFAGVQLQQESNVNLQKTPTQNLVNFGEASLKMLLEFYTKTANFEEILQQTVLVDIVKKLGEPLALKYRCPSQSTWQLAAASLNKVCQVGLPIARENVNQFKQLWPTFASTVEGFLFSTSKSQQPLNADERKRHEFMDCLVVELIRAELLPWGQRLPRDFMQSLIDILNRGSINTMDPNDVLASDVHQQRTDLSRVCFDALLSLSQQEEPTTPSKSTAAVGHGQQAMGMLRNTSQTAAACSSLGATAIASLLNRCKQVLNAYARDEQSAGHFRLPQERIFETISALRAVTALIEGFSKSPSATLYSHLVTLHPSLVQLIPASRGDQQVELALMTCLNSYQTLLLLNLHNSK